MTEEVSYKKIEDTVFKLLSAKYQVENILKLIEGNPYEQYMNLKLTSVYYELERRLSLRS